MIDEFFRIYSPILMIFLATSLFNQKERLGKTYVCLSYLKLISYLSICLSSRDRTNEYHYTRRSPKAFLGGYQNLRNHSLMMFIFSCCGVYFFFQSKKMALRIFYGGYCLTTLSFLYLTRQEQHSLYSECLHSSICILPIENHGSLQGLLLPSLLLLLIKDYCNVFLDLRISFHLYRRKNSAQEIDLSSMGSGRFGLWSNSYGSVFRPYPPRSCAWSRFWIPLGIN